MSWLQSQMFYTDIVQRTEKGPNMLLLNCSLCIMNFLFMQILLHILLIMSLVLQVLWLLVLSQQTSSLLHQRRWKHWVDLVCKSHVTLVLTAKQKRHLMEQEKPSECGWKITPNLATIQTMWFSTVVGQLTSIQWILLETWVRKTAPLYFPIYSQVTQTHTTSELRTNHSWQQLFVILFKYQLKVREFCFFQSVYYVVVQKKTR